MEHDGSRTDEMLAQPTPPGRRQLRDRARAALEAGIENLEVRSLDDKTYSVSALIEDLRVYQAELEIQNEQLRETQQAAQNAARRFAALFAGVPVAVLVIESFGLITHCNPAAMALFSLEERHLLQNFLLRLIERRDQERVAGALNRIAGARELHCTDISFRAGRGRLFRGDMHLAPLESLVPGATQYICAVVDQTLLTEQQNRLEESAEQLRMGEQRLGAVINSALQAIIGIDAAERIVVFNPAAEALFACDAETAKATAINAFFPAADAMISLALTGQDSRPHEWQARTLAGAPLSVEVVGLPDATHGASLVTLFVRDLSEAKAAEAQRKLLELQLLESQKMQAVGTLAGGIAHDFNNMLSAILGNLTLAQKDAPPDSALMESLVEIEKASLRARNLVRQILAFSRKDSARRERLDLGDLIRETAGLVHVGLPPAVEFSVDVAPDLPMIVGDPGQVQQAVLNLCTNALDAVRDGGRVVIDARGGEADEATRLRLGLEPGMHAIVRVTDNGTGMAPEVLRQVFVPFFTTKPMGHGTGLGLSVVHGAMRTHHGAVQADSTPGQGSTFTLYFPAALLEIADQGGTVTPVAPLEGPHGERVMYVDDDEALVFVVERMLGREGYRVSGFTEPGAALAALKRDPAGIDLMITDYNMPGMSGLDVARQARAIRADLPLVLCSGYVTPAMETAAADIGIGAVMHKPNQVEDLLGAIRGALDRAGKHD